MGNMSYCRFENTLHDLRDCYNAADEGGELSESEEYARKQLLLLCRKFVIDNEDEIEELLAERKRKQG